MKPYEYDWKVKKDEEHGHISIVDGRGFTLADLSVDHTPDNALQNANVMAAAPELLLCATHYLTLLQEINGRPDLKLIMGDIDLAGTGNFRSDLKEVIEAVSWMIAESQGTV